MEGGLAPPGFVVVFVVVGEGLAPPAGAGLAPPAGAGLAPPGFLASGQMEFPSTEIPSNGNGFVVWLARHPPLATSSRCHPEPGPVCGTAVRDLTFHTKRRAVENARNSSRITCGRGGACLP